ncbi:Rieske 2Fe-2S domain-containing protein [Paraburkholderia phymatum]|uniref:Rieske (2Fe-2S) domain protein n=1 Tax=Paraburkholderia phymatum (strain DSM 17167 / CIP 108236 / LMG 21445 / STM815) TaxID=391038 RepID=B2JUL0_PARP8|nr:Rieske 2Fe-2S domain-containing protein [Paraburkholderia phymatum]ACC76181.1 Rieske (2Fe-2S) domain protein [Paraburkholderia phymatum STM815]
MKSTLDHRVCRADELAPGQRKIVFVDGRSIALFNLGGELRAIDDACPHNGASLLTGRLEGSVLRCPAHGLPFDLLTGCSPAGRALCLTTFPLRQVEDGIVITLQSSDSPTCSPT